MTMLNGLYKLLGCEEGENINLSNELIQHVDIDRFSRLRGLMKKTEKVLR